MCQTSYRWYSKCKCIYIGEHPDFCSNFASNHPEVLGGPPFKPKLLTRAHKGLDVDLNGISFMSADVDNQRAPRGLTCPDIRAFVQVEPVIDGCPLCESPHVLAAVHKKQAEGQRVLAKSAGTSDWKSMQKAVGGTASTGNDSVLRKENHLKKDPTDEAASRLLGSSLTRPTQTKSQTAATRAPDRRTDLVESRGHRHNVSDSSTSSGGYASSRDLDVCTGSPSYWDPLAD